MIITAFKGDCMFWKMVYTFGVYRDSVNFRVTFNCTSYIVQE